MIVKRLEYASPRIVRKVAIAVESPVLAGSVVDDINKASIESVGQQVETKDFSGSGFNHKWEE